jgi:hypothetical protein
VSVRDDPAWPPTRFAGWRLRSRVAAGLDGVTAVLGIALVVVPLIVAVASWPNDRALVSPADLEHWAAIALIPGWSWLLISSVLFYGLRQQNYRRMWGPRPSWPAIAAVGAVAAVCAFTIVGGQLIGAAKGSVRVVAGQHQVSTGSLNGGEWTSVSGHAYHEWQAKFLRLDSMFSLFGLIMLVFCARFRRLRRDDEAHTMAT